jgi:hypothetical protein
VKGRRRPDLGELVAAARGTGRGVRCAESLGLRLGANAAVQASGQPPRDLEAIRERVGLYLGARGLEAFERGYRRGRATTRGTV